MFLVGLAECLPEPWRMGLAVKVLLGPGNRVDLGIPVPVLDEALDLFRQGSPGLHHPDDLHLFPRTAGGPFPVPRTAGGPFPWAAGGPFPRAAVQP